MKPPETGPATAQRPEVVHRVFITTWLSLVCLLLLTIVAIGGITRLTGSGLSIVEWKPISGTLPPLNDAAWEAEFAAYQQSPQYKHVNHQMTLPEFKYIFFWEYIHRLLGRFIGTVYALPFMFLLLRRWVSRSFAWKLAFGLFLGGMQGVLGWWMVASGLVDVPYVSHFRLAAHLLLAFAITAYLFWLVLDLYYVDRGRVDANSSARTSPALRRLAMAFIVLLVMQITYGAFTAGLKAGFTANTFPLMNGHVVSPDAFSMQPFARNLVQNPFMVQFIHRTLGWMIAAMALALFLISNGAAYSFKQKAAAIAVAAIVFVQFLTGVITLLMAVPIPLAIIHQVGAIALLMAAVHLLFVLPSVSAKKRPLDTGATNIADASSGQLSQV